METYELTFKGWLQLELGDEEGQRLLDRIELFLRRRGYNAIILDETDFILEKVEPVANCDHHEA